MLKNKILTYPKVVCFLCGWMSVAALPPLYLVPILFISISALLYFINQSQSIKQAFGCGYAFGFAFFAFGLSWIGNALLIDHTFLMWLYPLVFIACGFFFGLFIAIPAALTRLFKNSLSQYLAFVALMVLFEWLRSFFLTGFPWNLWGSVFAFNSYLMQPAALGGTYLLSLLVLLIYVAPFLWLANRNRQNAAISIGIIIALFGFSGGYGYWRLTKADNTPSENIIRIVQPSIPQSLKWNKDSLEDNLKTYVELSQKQPLDGISAVLWGETASPFPLDLDERYNTLAREAIPEKGYLLTGQIRYYFSFGRQKAANSMLALNKEGQLLAFYDKSHLVPFGEYIPLRNYLPSWLRPLANTVGTFSAGAGPDNINIPNLPPFGAMICYEAIFPNQIIDENNRPQWVINPTNDGWYGNSFGPYQHLVAARLRAVENGITIARVANNGISALISPYGEIIKELGLNEVGAIDVKLPDIPSVTTPYSQKGNNIILIICTMFLVIAGYFQYQRKDL